MCEALPRSSADAFMPLDSQTCELKQKSFLPKLSSFNYDTLATENGIRLIFSKTIYFSITPENSLAGNVAQWSNACLACAKPQV
jgi:hypothetical protein